MTKILVTGGAGYIGSHAVRALLKANYEVVVLDNLVKGHKEFVPKNVAFYQIDVGDVEGLEKLFSEHQIDAVMHFAGYIEAGLSMKEPEDFFDVNCLEGANLLEAMRVANVKNMIFSSTAAVYGNPVSTPIKETDVLMPVNFYGDTKLFFERMLKVYDHAYGLKSICLRYFNASGADESGEIGEDHQPETHLIPNVFKAAKGEVESVKIFGCDYNTADGTCIRDYIHVSDLVDAHVLALAHLLKEQQSDVFNLGNGSGYSVREVIEVVKKVTGKDFKVEEAPRREGDPEVLIADSSKAESVLGWKRNFPKLEQIVASAWKWAE